MGTKHIKINVKKHEVKDFPLQTLEISEKWIGLLNIDTKKQLKLCRVK